MLKFDRVSFRWPKAVSPCLQQLSLNVNSGEWVALVGDNGAGKSTLLRLAAGLLAAETGTVMLQGEALATLNARQRAASIGVLFQEAEKQIFHTSVKDEIQFGLKRQKLAKEQIESRTAQALALCELSEYAHSHPLDLHAGQRRMVAVACLAALEPPLLLLDEPSRDFDAHWLGVFERWLEQCRNKGTTILTISHDLDFVARHFPRVIRLAAGQIVDDGSAQQVLQADELQTQSLLPAPTLLSLNQVLGTDYPCHVTRWSECWNLRAKQN